MADLEKVLKGLKKLRENSGCLMAYSFDCKTCPYLKVNGCCDQILADALELLNLMKAQKSFKCEACEYSYVEGFGKNERLLCEKHPEIKIADDFYCADYWDAQGR